MNTVFSSLREISAELFDLARIRECLGWDQEVYMPSGAAEGRGEQISTLSVLMHKKQTSEELNRFLSAAEKLISHGGEKISEEDVALVRVLRRGYNQSTKLPEAFVAEVNKVVPVAVNCWVDARKRKDFSLFQPYLEKIVELNRRETDYLGFSDHPMDALLDLYEEDLKAKDVARIFEEIKAPLIGLVEEAKEAWSETLSFDSDIRIEDQITFSKKLLTRMGYDFNRGRLDETVHPFMVSLGHDDRRVTSRYGLRDVGFIFTAMHEGGHALYEQGIRKSIARSVLDEGVSLGIHESQSRFWENIIGRSREFWEFYFTELQSDFPKHFGALTIDDWYRRINHVKPIFIRTESDELTYNLHILIRFEIEKALIEGSLTVKDAPEAWNAKYKEYLGLTVPDDAMGILQDVHWAHGTIGYFATYTLGNLASAQIWESYKKHDPHYKETVRGGKLDKILSWLTENIYQYGSIYQPQTLIEQVTGEKLSSHYLIEYLRSKYLLLGK